MAYVQSTELAWTRQSQHGVDRVGCTQQIQRGVDRVNRGEERRGEETRGRLHCMQPDKQPSGTQDLLSRNQIVPLSSRHLQDHSASLPI